MEAGNRIGILSLSFSYQVARKTSQGYKPGNRVLGLTPAGEMRHVKRFVRPKKPLFQRLMWLWDEQGFYGWAMSERAVWSTT